MSLRVSPISPGHSYMIHCDGNELPVLARNSVDALLWYLSTVVGVK